MKPILFILVIATLHGLGLHHAAAASLGARGEGQVLLFPFVTGENGWDTYLNLSLSREGGQIVRLRVLEPRDGALIDSFTIYASSAENWRAAVTVADGDPVLRIAEGSCTLSDKGEFGGPGAEFPLGSSLSLIEVYVISEKMNESTRGETCAELAARWDEAGAWRSDPSAGLEASDGAAETDISGYFDLVNVEAGLSGSLPATSFLGFKDFIEHTPPESMSPNLGEADPIAEYPDGSTFVPDSEEGIDAIAALISAQDITNNVITASEIAASTDWVIVFPLSAYKLYGRYSADFGGESRRCSVSGLLTDTAPYVEVRVEDPWSSWGQGVESVGNLLDIIPVPNYRYTPILCNAVNTLTFGNNAPVLLAEASDFQDRVNNINNHPAFLSVAETVEYWFSDGAGGPPQIGRPLIAFRVTTFLNGTLNGGNTLANYMTTVPHRMR